MKALVRRAVGSLFWLVLGGAVSAAIALAAQTGALERAAIRIGFPVLDSSKVTVGQILLAKHTLLRGETTTLRFHINNGNRLPLESVNLLIDNHLFKCVTVEAADPLPWSDIYYPQDGRRHFDWHGPLARSYGDYVLYLRAASVCETTAWAGVQINGKTLLHYETIAFDIR